jgi:hypothetical protein
VKDRLSQHVERPEQDREPRAPIFVIERREELGNRAGLALWQ